MRVLLDATTLKIAKLKKILSMAMTYTTEFEHVIKQDANNKKLWSMIYLHNVLVKHLKTAMQFGKSNKVVKLKLKWLKTHSRVHSSYCPTQPSST